MAIPTVQEELTSYPGVIPRDFNFVMSYLLDFNVSAAAKRVGLCKDQAYKILKKRSVKKMIRDKGREVEERCDVTLEQCYNELKRIAFFDHNEYMTDFKFEVEEGAIGVTLEEFQKIDTRAIKTMSQKINAQGIPYVEITPYDKIAALKELITNLKGYQGPSSVHLHLNKEEAKKLSASEIAANYQIMVQEED